MPTRCSTERSAQKPIDHTKSQRERDDMLVRELMRYAARRFPESLLEWREQFDDIEAIDQFRGPLSLYHVPFEGRTIVDWFLEDRGSKLAPEDLEILHAQRRSWMSAWEARDVEPGAGMTLVDLLTGETRRVAERSGSRGLVERDGVLARVVEIGGVQLVCGMYPRVLPPEGVADVVASMKKWLKRTGKNVPVREALLEHEVALRLCLLWQDAVADADIASLLPPRLSNTDGDPLLLTTDLYAFEPANGEEIARRLAAMEGVVAPAPGERDSGYDVLRPGNKMHAHWDNTVIGRVFVPSGELRVETNSIKRGDALCERLEAVLGGLVRHRARAHEDPVSGGAMARLRERAKGPRTLERERTVPPELLATLRREKVEFYRAWLDQPIRALGGKTPRQAARNKGSRVQLDVLLKTIENREARGPAAERFDVRVLREELGLVDQR